MSTTINALAAGEHIADLHRAAERWHRNTSSVDDGYAPGVELRLVHGDEADVVSRLAALDDAPELEGPVLLALVDGEAVAGLSLRDRRVISNPFVYAGDTVALLRLRAEHLSRAPARRRLRRLLRLRLA